MNIKPGSNTLEYNNLRFAHCTMLAVRQTQMYAAIKKKRYFPISYSKKQNIFMD